MDGRMDSADTRVRPLVMKQSMTRFYLTPGWIQISPEAPFSQDTMSENQKKIVEWRKIT